jgi:hypothetical protein
MKARHERTLARLALLLLALIAELAGRGLTHRLDVGRHVGRVSYAHADYYPVLVAAVKVGAALMLARIAWRFAKARRVAALLRTSPRVRVELSARLWLASFIATSAVYLVQMDTEAEKLALAPLVHTSALPIFAVLSVLVALVYRSVEQCLHEYEQLAAHAVAFVQRALVSRPLHVTPRPADAPRRRFGLAFESRPPPVPA